MKKIILTLVVIAVLVIGYWLVSPLWKTVKVSEVAPQTTGQDISKTIKAGKFQGFDKLHQGSGTATVIKSGAKTYIRFETDFKVTNGPDLYVGLGNNGQYIKGSEIAKLKGTEGSQNYELSDGIDPKDINEVWIWCKTFAVPFASAKLK